MASPTVIVSRKPNEKASPQPVRIGVPVVAVSFVLPCEVLVGDQIELTGDCFYIVKSVYQDERGYVANVEPA